MVLFNLLGLCVGLLCMQLELIVLFYFLVWFFSSCVLVFLLVDDVLFVLNLWFVFDELLCYQWKISVFVLNGGQFELVQGLLQIVDQCYFVIGLDVLGIWLWCVEVDVVLLCEACIELSCQGLCDGRFWIVWGQVDSECCCLVFVLLCDLQDGMVIVIVIVLVGDCSCILFLQVFIDNGMYLDVFSFEGSGVCYLLLVCEFDDDVLQVLIELVFEDWVDEFGWCSLWCFMFVVFVVDWSWIVLFFLCSGYCWCWVGQIDWLVVFLFVQVLQFCSSQVFIRSML